MSDYKKLAVMARAWADRAGIKKVKLVRSDVAGYPCAARLEIYTEDGAVNFSRWRTGRYPACQRFSLIGSGKWDKRAEATGAALLAQAKAEFDFLSLCGMSLTPGQVSECALDGVGPELDEAGLCLIDELERAFDGLQTPRPDYWAARATKPPEDTG